MQLNSNTFVFERFSSPREPTSSHMLSTCHFVVTTGAAHCRHTAIPPGARGTRSQPHVTGGLSRGFVPWKASPLIWLCGGREGRVLNLPKPVDALPMGGVARCGASQCGDAPLTIRGVCGSVCSGKHYPRKGTRPQHWVRLPGF